MNAMSLLDPHMLIHLVVRGLDLAAMMLVVGGLAFESFVAAPALRQLDVPPSERRTAALAFRRRHTRLVGWSLAALLVIQGIDIVLRVQMMSSRPFSVVVGLFPQAIVGTHIGKAWLGKMAVLVGLLIIWILTLNVETSSSSRPTWHRRALLIGAGLFCLMVALAGHAADRGNVSVDVAADWLHVMAVSAWLGGLVALRVLLPAALDSLDEKTAARLFTRALDRFSTMAGWAVGIMVATGTYSIWLHIPTWAGLSGTYGIALIAKLALVAPMIGLGALARFVSLPTLRALTGESVRSGPLTRFVTRCLAVARRMAVRRTASAEATATQIRRRCLRFILFECALAVGVLAGTAVLTQTMPPHVTDFETPGMTDMPGMSMD
ncbi:MAG: CopD family protein [Nitrospirae bacterium]|nr:CopD family protein [Nitrospirota bacterium]